MEAGAILEMRGICKYFPGVRALEKVDFTLREGEIHALMGENGAGNINMGEGGGGAGAAGRADRSAHSHALPEVRAEEEAVEEGFHRAGAVEVEGGSSSYVL